MKTGIIIQARLGSTRLPNKMILPFYNGKGILEILLIRLLEAIDLQKTPIILATSDNPLDDSIEKIGDDFGITVFRGSEQNVLNRFIKAARFNNLSHIVRICADNPLLDMLKLQQLIVSTENKNYDYYAYATSDLKPTILTSFGFWAEFVSLDALEKVESSTNEEFFREHVTNYVYTHPNNFNIKYSLINPQIEREENIRLTIDTEADFEVVKEIFTELKEKNIDFSAESIVKFISSESNWTKQMKSQILANKK